MARKMPRRLVALSAGAIAAVYLAGYVTTQSADAQLDPARSAPIAALTAPPAAPPSGSTIARSVPQPAPIAGAVLPAATPAGGSAAVATPGYRDGTYQGSGTSRRGGVEAAVT